MFASLKKLFARTTRSATIPVRPTILAVESLETREVPAGYAMEDTIVTGVHSGWVGVIPEPQPGSPATIARAAWDQVTNTHGLAGVGHGGWIVLQSVPIDQISLNTHVLAGPTAAPEAGQQQVRIQGLGKWIEIQSVSGGAEAGHHFNQGRIQETGDAADRFLSKINIDFKSVPQPGSPTLLKFNAGTHALT
jgi:hypothetical protein